MHRILIAVGAFVCSTVGAVAQTHKEPPPEARATRPCAKGSFNFNFGQASKEIEGRTIVQGEVCGGYHWRPGKVQLKRLLIASPPQRGQLSLRDPGQLYYRAPMNYMGPDRFTIRLCGEGPRYAGCIDLIYTMQVVAR